MSPHSLRMLAGRALLAWMVFTLCLIGLGRLGYLGFTAFWCIASVFVMYLIRENFLADAPLLRAVLSYVLRTMTATFLAAIALFTLALLITAQLAFLSDTAYPRDLFQGNLDNLTRAQGLFVVSLFAGVPAIMSFGVSLGGEGRTPGYLARKKSGLARFGHGFVRLGGLVALVMTGLFFVLTTGLQSRFQDLLSDEAAVLISVIFLVISVAACLFNLGVALPCRWRMSVRFAWRLAMRQAR